MSKWENRIFLVTWYGFLIPTCLIAGIVIWEILR